VTVHVVATAGHVDHGKSTLVRALTGTDPDRFLEEKQRGLTIDLGFAWMSLPRSGSVAFVDVPGHVRFISNMLAGVAVIEAGLLCIDTREGWRPQTEEHLRILDLVGLHTGVVVLTKAGLVDDDRLEEVRTDVALRTAGTVLADVPMVECDAVDGTGLDLLRTTLDDALTACPPARDRARPRLWVDRSFTIAGAGTVVTGGVGHGTFAVGDQVVAGCHPARIRSIQALGRRVDTAPPGSRAALNLAGLDRRAVRRGDAVVRPDDDWQVTDRADGTLTVLDALDHEVTRRGAYLAYIGTGEHAVRLRLLDETSLIPGELGTVRLTFEQRLPLVAGDRYILRDTGRRELIGGGELVDLHPARRPRTAASIEDWTPVAELERRFGMTVEPTVADMVVSPAGITAACNALVEKLGASRPVGLDVAHLDKRERAVLALLEEDEVAETVAGYAVLAAWRDELAAHPLVVRLEQDLFAPPLPSELSVTPEELRALRRRGLVLVKDGLYFAANVRVAATHALADLARRHPEGFTVSDAREVLGTTRKWAVPLLELLDEAQITLRHGDRRTFKP